MKKFWPYLSILIITLLAFYPVFQGKVPLNARNLVAFFSPWYYQKFEGFPTGVPSKPGIPDQLRIYFPYMSLTQWSYRLGQLPLWNPYNFAGNPHMAESQAGVFYPMHILLPFLPLTIYWITFQVSGFFLVGCFTYLYLRNIGLKRISSVFGGLTFMLSGFVSTWNMEVVTAPHSILWLPLILLAIDKITAPKTASKKVANLPYAGRFATFHTRWWLVGLAGLVMSILSGYWQTTFYVMAVSLIYAVYRIISLYGFKALIIDHRSLIIYSWIPLSFALTAFQLLPTWELFQRSGRPIVNFRFDIQAVYLAYLLPFRHLVTLFAPDYFGHPTTRNYFANVGGGSQYYEHMLFIGTIPLLFTIFAVVYARKNKDKKVLFWFIVSLAAASFSFRTPWARSVYSLRVPLLSTGIANRILFIPAFGLSVLAAYGLNFVKEKFAVNTFTKVMGTGLGLIVVLFVVTLIGRSGLGAFDPKINPTLYVTSIRNMIIPTGVFLFGSVLIILTTRRGRWANLFLAGALVISLSQTLYQHYKFTPFSEKDFVYPLHSTIEWLKDNAGTDRFIGYNGQFLNNNFATYFRIYAVEGYDSLNDYRRSMLLYSADTGSVEGQLPRSVDALLGQNLTNPRVIRLMQLFGIRYLVDHPEWLDVGPTAGLPRLPAEKEKLVFQDGDWKILEYPDAYPRAFLAGKYEVVKDGQEMIDRLYSEDFNPREAILLSEPLSDWFEIKSDDAGSVDIEKYTPTKIIFKTRSKTNQLLFLSDTYYPGWWYRIDDGEKLPVLAADYALRAGAVPAGEHKVTMWYFPDSFRNGLVIAGAALVIVLVITSRRFWPSRVQER